MATTIRVPVDMRNPRVSSLAGNSFWRVAALTNYDAGYWEFVKDVDGKLYGLVMVPKNLDAAPTAKIVLATAYNATSGVARWSIKTKDPADGETFDASFTSETAQDITAPGTAKLRKDVTFTLTNAPAADDILLIEVFHEGAHANDTVAVNSLLFGAWLEINLV